LPRPAARTASLADRPAWLARSGSRIADVEWAWFANLHGHSDKWESKDIQQRFGYRYSDEELATWAGNVKRLAQDAAGTHVVFNNCYRDWAQVNAQRLAELAGAA